MKGIEVACAAGLVAAHSERQLEVLAHINAVEKEEIKKLASNGLIKIHVSEEPDIFTFVFWLLQVLTMRRLLSVQIILILLLLKRTVLRF